MERDRGVFVDVGILLGALLIMLIIFVVARWDTLLAMWAWIKFIWL